MPNKDPICLFTCGVRGRFLNGSAGAPEHARTETQNLLSEGLAEGGGEGELAEEGEGRRDGDRRDGDEEDEADCEAVEQVPRGGAVQAALQGGQRGGQREEGAGRIPQESQARLQVGSRCLSPQAQKPPTVPSRSQGKWIEQMC